ncbi:phosphatidylinositol N-acetylglucosaminyltransferase [Synchytrium microbalum]|uniref:Phosphatidylinositol N-acetylglucosaminyltransferase n=1 Tax=Synchytrium microbalum TaxID=1806994 RepID=A0A507C1P2_9FUNG|nr:phosphatidylinositol N-acetylglucosaminyltransferase [Synchytrium microbalum]TPX33341.1 phosphatidylinositol N-acetylglucosaminyltransferase [Synchytrium microbalum]
MRAAQPAPWQRKLYLKQNYPDNHVDPAFLTFVKERHHDATPLNYWNLVMQTGAITQQVATTIMLIYCFTQLQSKHSTTFLVSLGLALLFVGGIVLWCQQGAWIQSDATRLRAVALLLAALLLLSPVLKTLTQDTSDDTLYALTTLLFICNWLFHDYNVEQNVTFRFPDSVSINAAIFASVLLASRLSTSLHVFALMATSFELCALLPGFRRALRRSSNSSNVALTLLMGIISISMLLHLSPPIGLLYMAVLILVTFAGPAVLIQFHHKYKKCVILSQIWIA